MKLASFDIFDTVLIRKCGLPENIFCLLARRLFPENKALQEEFLLWRKQAGAKAQARKGPHEVNISDIYNDEYLRVFEEYAPTQLLEAEVQIETENLIANPDIRQLIEQKRKEGFVICFISDMYLNSDFLGKSLKRENCLMGNEHVFVSCEYDARKSNGTLYDIVKEKYRPAIWQHFGDNLRSDVKIARKKGIDAQKINSDFTEIEKLLLKRSENHQYADELSIVVGLERAARLTNRNDSEAEIAANFVAPAYISYIHFVFKDAQRRGIKCLYFLSRDSHILIKIAEQERVKYPDIEIRYLFVSRKALLLPFMKNADQKSYLSVQDNRTILRRNVNELLPPLKTTKHELQERYGINLPYSKIFGRKEEKDFLEKIFGKNSTFLPVLKTQIKKQRELIVDYFRQEGLFENKKSAMVDVGWLGNSRIMINDILQSEGALPVEFYYFGVRSDVYSSQYGIYTSFYRPNQLSTELTALVENYFSASPYPSTIGYQRKNNKIVQKFACGKNYLETEIIIKNTNIAKWISNEIKCLNLNMESIYWDWAKISLDAISQLSTKINLSSLVKSNSFDETPFVRKLTIKELLYFLCLGKRITAFDRASIEITCTRKLSNILWRLHRFTGSIRRKLYLKLVK